MDKKFIWGAATASYQIEGHHDEFQTIWDTFSAEGNVYKKHNGEFACNHVNLFKEDVNLLKELGVDHYRFSISWARIMPTKDEISSKGIEFYTSLLQELKNAGIQTNVTMYHWDMPSWIYETNGGWISRDTVSLFLDYAKVLFENFDDYVDLWSTFNEPFCSTYLGYFTGDHAPGHRSIYEYFRSTHYLLLSHGEVVNYYKKHYKKPIGLVLNLSDVKTTDQNASNMKAVSMQDAVMNRLYLDLVFKKGYPVELVDYLETKNIKLDFIDSGDLEIIGSGFDFLGVNFYTHSMVRYNSNKDFFIDHAKTSLPKTAMGWDITPEALEQVIVRLRKEYTDIPIYITENGAAFDDVVTEGVINDDDRIDYIEKHLDVILRMKEEYGIKGYYVWSLLDNFEWAYGYSKRFGIVHVDFETFKRIPKNSFYYLKKMFKENNH